jgi:hypothetical protein
MEQRVNRVIKVLQETLVQEERMVSKAEKVKLAKMVQRVSVVILEKEVQ